MKQSNLLLAQLNPTVGDIEGNARKIMDAYTHAERNGASIVICPELMLTGYPPEDLLLMPSFRKAAMEKARGIAAATGDAALVFGTVWEENGAVYNAAIFAAEGRIQHIHHKIMLPNYGVFDEKRYFTPGHGTKVIEWKGLRLAVLVCEDIWHLQFAQDVVREKADMVLVINASPFETGKMAARKKVTALAAGAVKAPIVYVNMVGGQDDIVFDGASFVVNKAGYVTHEASHFEEELFVVPLLLENAGTANNPAMAEEEEIWKAMKLGLADYVSKNGFKGVLLGLSGGIDSAVTAALAVDALGSKNVRGVLLPSPYTSQESIDDALETERLLGIRTDTIPITPAMDMMQQTLQPLMDEVMEKLAIGGNIQARIRGQILMAISNESGFMLLSTGNKSELAVGYTTLYGDSCGGYNVLKDIYKTNVYKLAHWRNGQSIVIPARSISKAPSAELAPGQKDSDQLPDYELLDQILALHLEGQKNADEIPPMGYDAKTVERVLKLVRINEYKRRQSCPGVKITPMMFGRDRRYPLTNAY